MFMMLSSLQEFTQFIW